MELPLPFHHVTDSESLVPFLNAPWTVMLYSPVSEHSPPPSMALELPTGEQECPLFHKSTSEQDVCLSIVP